MRPAGGSWNGGGFEQALTSVNRRCAIDAFGETEEQALLDRSATAAAAEYEIISWIGRTPTELIDTMCRLDSMLLSEVPLGDLNIEPETIDAELKEAKAARNEAVGVLPVTTVARHRATGEAVANTIIGVFDDPDFHHGFQWITIVHPAHRGHRLGTLVKVVNHRLLREQFPQVQTLWTDNADANAHMIDINIKMGYETVDAIAEYMRRLGSLWCPHAQAGHVGGDASSRSAIVNSRPEKWPDQARPAPSPSAYGESEHPRERASHMFSRKATHDH